MSSLDANDNLAMTDNSLFIINTTFYDIFILALFIDMYRVCVSLFSFFYISFPLAFFQCFLICVVTAPLNGVTWSHGATEMLLLL